LLTLARLGWTFAFAGPAPYYFTAFHSTGLIIGALIAFSRPKLRLGRWAFAILLLLIVGGMATVTHLVPQILAEIATALIIMDPPAILSAASMQFLGRISYGVYLWHIPLLWAVGNQLVAGLGFLSGVIVLAALSCFVGWLSYVLVERRFLRALRSVAATPRISHHRLADRVDCQKTRVTPMLKTVRP
jgi:peptidoglycan/LPS O-acetylase OafA/YrhL